jgi:uncharacterized protein (DUF58 family)
VAERTVDGLLHGDHCSRRIGASVEFADYKEYAPGDNLRDLDWRVMGRSDRRMIKRYEVETELRCTVVLDASGDLATGEGAPYGLPPLEGSKFGYALTLTACLLWFLHKHNEPVGLAVVAGRGREGTRVLPPRSGRTHQARLFAELASLAPGGTADLHQAIAKVAPRLRRRSLVLLVSDFMEEPSRWAPALAALARRRTELRAFHVLDRRELSLDYDNAALFYSPEDGERLEVDPLLHAEEFARVRDAWMLEVRQGLQAHRGRYQACWTDQPLAPALRRVVGALA